MLESLERTLDLVEQYRGDDEAPPAPRDLLQRLVDEETLGVSTVCSALELLADADAFILLGRTRWPLDVAQRGVSRLRHAPLLTTRHGEYWGLRSGVREHFHSALVSNVADFQPVLEVAVSIAAARRDESRKRLGDFHALTRQCQVMLVDAAAPIEEVTAQREYKQATIAFLSLPDEHDVEPLVGLRRRWGDVLTPEPLAQVFHSGLEAYRLGSWEDARSCFDQVVATAPESEYAMIAWHLLAKISASQSRGRWAECESFLRRSLELHRTFKNAAGEAMVLTSLGRCLTDQGRLEDAFKALTEAKKLAESLHIAPSMALIVSAAVVDYKRGDTDKAIASLKEAAKAQRRRQDLRNLAKTLNTLGRAYTLRRSPGDIDCALKAYEESLELGRSLRMARHTGIVANGLARELMNRGRRADLQRARTLLQEAERLHSMIGFAYGLSMARRSMDELDDLARDIAEDNWADYWGEC